MKKLKIVMAGGGTGGHVFPIQNIIKHLDKNYSEKIEKLYRFGSPNSLEEKTFSTLEVDVKISFVPIVSGKFRREKSLIGQLKNIRDFFLFLFAILKSFIFLYKERPDIIFCKGGFVALPLLISSILFDTKIIVHESDTKAGITNKIAYYLSKKAFTAFPGVFKKEELVGQILSDDLSYIDNYLLGSKEISIGSKKIPLGKKTICLIIGGSQGSKSLYSDIGSILSYNKKLLESYIFIIVGGFTQDDFTKLFPKSTNIHFTGFVDAKKMRDLLYISDISITRGGSTSLAEQELFYIKKIIVPIPRTHDQLHNAKYYLKHHKDILIQQDKPGFQETLDLTLQQNIGYKKSKISETNLTTIYKTKTRICESFFNS